LKCPLSIKAVFAQFVNELVLYGLVSADSASTVKDRDERTPNTVRQQGIYGLSILLFLSLLDF
jgi:hypothetical protein